MWHLPARKNHTSRAQRVGVFNFGSGMDRVLEKIFRDGSGMDRVRVFASYISSIGYYRVLEILIGYFSGISLRHIYLMVPEGFWWTPMVLIVALMIQDAFNIRERKINSTYARPERQSHKF